VELFLWRHADALPGSPDSERKLSPHGHKQARKAAEWIREHPSAYKAPGLRLFVSPALRARQTVAHFCEDEKTIQLCLPLYENATPGEILQIIGWPAPPSPSISTPALIVGHEPLMGMIADQLLATTPHPLTFPQGALWQLRLLPGRKNVQLVHVLEP